MSVFSHVVRLAWIDVSRMVRKHTNWSGSGASVISVGMYLVILLIGTVGGGYLGYRLGGLLVSGDGIPDLGPFEPIELIRGVVALMWLMISLIFVIRIIGQRGVLPQPEGVLTVVPTREAVGGVLLAEFLYFLMWLLLPSIGVGTGLALGTGTIWPAVAVPLAVAAAGIASLGLAFPLGLSIRHVASRFEFVARHKGAILVLVFVAYFISLSTGAWNELMVQLFEPMQRSPVGWYADLTLFWTPVLGASYVFAVGALALSIVLGAVAIVASTYVANRHWFSDPALAGKEESPPSEFDAHPGLERRLDSILGAKTAALVVLSWRRALRSPLKLLYAFYPLLILAGLFAEIAQTGDIPAYLPFAILLSSAWAAGVIFTLNPFGDQGAALPSTLLSRVRGRTFVHAHLLAALVIAIPIGAVATGGVAVLSPLDRGTAVLLVVGSPIILILSAILSIGIGSAFPRFEATNVTRSMKTVLPSRWAFVLFTAYLFLTAGAAAVVYEPLVRTLGAGLISWILPFGWSISAETLYLVAALSLVPLLLAPVPAYWYSIRRFDRYTLG